MTNIEKKIQINIDASIKEALKKLDDVGEGILFVCDKDDVLIGALTDGDLRRRILKTNNLQESIQNCYNPNPKFFNKDDYTISEIKKVMSQNRIEAIPLVDKNKKIVNVLFWDNIFGEKNNHEKKIDLPVVIMAGGEGKRLRPFTMILPKPLIPIGDEPIIKILMDKFNKYNVNHFYITLNYKGDMIKTYLEAVNKDYFIDYIWEEEFLGTAGSLKLLPENIADTFIVSNCDIIINSDYRDLARFHEKNNCKLTVVGSLQNYRVPYGIIDFAKEGRIKEIREKPEIELTINTGVYVLSKSALDYIPDNKFYNMTDLIQDLLDKKENVRVYPGYRFALQ